MALLPRLASATTLVELTSAAEIAEAEALALKGWVKVRHAPMSKGLETYGQHSVYAEITPTGRRALDARAA